MPLSRFRAVLFDMDGTLVHTGPDIAAALNAALCKNGLPPLEEARIVDLVGKGAVILVKRALSLQNIDDAWLAASVFEDYNREYSARIGRGGYAFPGANECLRELHDRDIKLAVVTNALQRFAEATLAHYGLAKYFSTIVGGDRTAAPKPHPASLWFACRTLEVNTDETLMVGDSINDVAAARAAGCSVVCVPHGYNEGRSLADFQCEVISGLEAIPAWLDAHAGPSPVPSNTAFSG